MDFRRNSPDPAPLHINGECVERVHCFKFLGGPHFCGPVPLCLVLVGKHQGNHQEEAAEAVIPEGPQEKPHGQGAAGQLLQVCC